MRMAVLQSNASMAAMSVGGGEPDASVLCLGQCVRKGLLCGGGGCIRGGAGAQGLAAGEEGVRNPSGARCVGARREGAVCAQTLAHASHSARHA